MQTKQKKAVANTSFGKAHPPLPFSYEWQVYDTTDEMVAAKDEMTLEEQRKARNTEKQNNARGKALKAAQDARGNRQADGGERRTGAAEGRLQNVAHRQVARRHAEVYRRTGARGRVNRYRRCVGGRRGLGLLHWAGGQQTSRRSFCNT